jgi:hypothetical protein
MNYYVYGNSHRLCRDLTIYNDEFSPDLLKFCINQNLREADGVACAYANKTLFGFFRYDIDIDGTMHANGTWINFFKRGKGIGFDLWSKALKKVKPPKVVAILTSDGGEKLFLKVRDAFPKILFCNSRQI